MTSGREWELRAKLAESPGVAVEVVAVFDRWQPVPLAAYEAYIVAATEADAEPAEPVAFAKRLRSLETLFDGCVRSLTVGGEKAEPGEVSGFVRAELALELLRSRHAEGNAPSPASAET